MLDKTQMQEIQDLKLRGYTKSEILKYYREQGRKPPSRPTISKYYDMDVVPDDPGANLSKDKAFDVSPFREDIIAILEANSRKDYCISSVYDVLEEKFIENGDLESLPGNEQTLRNYVHYLEGSGQIDTGEEHRRVYDHVFDTPPGEQMLIDFGELTLSKKCVLSIRIPQNRKENSPLSDWEFPIIRKRHKYDGFWALPRPAPRRGGRKAARAAFANQGSPCRLCQGLPGRFASSVLSLDTAPALG